MCTQHKSRTPNVHRNRQYEGKLATLTAINSALKSENDTLRQQLDEATAPQSNAEEELLELKAEFTKRLGQHEKKIQGLKVLQVVCRATIGHKPQQPG